MDVQHMLARHSVEVLKCRLVVESQESGAAVQVFKFLLGGVRRRNFLKS